MEKEQEPRPSYSKSVYLLSLKRCAGCQLFMHSSPCGLAIPVLHSLVLLPNASKRSLALLGRSAAVLVMSAASPGRSCIPGGGNGEKKRWHYKTSAYISLVRSVSMAAPADGKQGNSVSTFYRLCGRDGQRRNGLEFLNSGVCHLLCFQCWPEEALLPTHTHDLRMLFFCRAGGRSGGSRHVCGGGGRWMGGSGSKWVFIVFLIY